MSAEFNYTHILKALAMAHDLLDNPTLANVRVAQELLDALEFRIVSEINEEGAMTQ